MAIKFVWPVITGPSERTKLRKELDKLRTELVELRKNGGLNIPGELLKNLYGDESSASIAVSESNALTISAVYNAINILCDSINIPVEIYKRTPDGNRKPVTMEDRYEYQCRYLLHTSPNLMMTPTQWFQLMEASRVIYGNGISLIIRNKLKEPTALRWFHPDLVEVKVRNNIELRYWFRFEQGGGYEFEDVSALDVIHVKNFSTNGITGRGVIDLAADSLSGGLAAQKTSNKFYQEGMTSKIVLSHPGALSATGKQNLQSSFDQEMKNKSNIILEEGTKLYTVSIPPEQAQFLESRVFSVTEVARWFNIPEHMVSNNQHSTFSNIENQFLQFIINNVRPRVRMWEQELNWKLLTNYADFYTEFNMDALLRADTQAQASYFMTAIQNGWMSRNEVRALKNLNKIEGGDDFLTPMNLATDKEREKNLQETVQNTDIGEEPDGEGTEDL